MKKMLTVFWLAVFLLSVPLFAEARNATETQPASPNSTALELNQYTGVGRIRTRRRVRRRVRRHMRRQTRRRMVRRYRVYRTGRRTYVIRRR